MEVWHCPVRERIYFFEGDEVVKACVLEPKSTIDITKGASR
jgi:hypothetical protein